MSGETASTDVAQLPALPTAHIADAWFDVLTEIDPTLASDTVRRQVGAWTSDFVASLGTASLDTETAMVIGRSLEELDSIQPGEVVRLQVTIARAFSETLAADDWLALQLPITELLFALGAGFYAGKSQRASRFAVDVTSRMGHDLKTPINAITGFSRVILKGIDGPVTDFQREDLTSIYEAGQKLLTMINDLYAVRKKDAERTLIYEQPFLVSELLADIVRTVQPLAAQRSLVFAVKAKGDLGRMSLAPSQVRWVLLSLLSHAIRNASTGEITLTVERVYQEVEKLTFTVVGEAGTGIWGLRRDARESAGLETDVACDENLDGSCDIGLLTCQQIVEELQGAVSQCGLGDHGITFTVCLPAENQESDTCT